MLHTAPNQGEVQGILSTMIRAHIILTCYFMIHTQYFKLDTTSLARLNGFTEIAAQKAFQRWLPSEITCLETILIIDRCPLQLHLL